MTGKHGPRDHELGSWMMGAQTNPRLRVRKGFPEEVIDVGMNASFRLCLWFPLLRSRPIIHQTWDRGSDREAQAESSGPKEGKPRGST